MDTISFINSIGYSNFEKSVTNYFDENMALYNLVHDYTGLKINGEIEGSSIKFHLNFNSNKDAKKMYDALLCKPSLYLFNREFIVKETLDRSNLIVEFS